MTSSSLWNYLGDEVNDAVYEIVANHRKITVNQQ